MSMHATSVDGVPDSELEHHQRRSRAMSLTAIRRLVGVSGPLPRPYRILLLITGLLTFYALLIDKPARIAVSQYRTDARLRLQAQEGMLATVLPIESLAFAKPLNPKVYVPPSYAIPRNIWYKVGAKGIWDENRQHMDTCIRQNPNWEHKMFDDATADEFVTQKYEAWPRLVEVFVALQVAIWKADFFRYLVLFVEGGAYSDLDVECLGTPMDDWIPPQFVPANPSLVVGWEMDINEPTPDGPRQFATWMFLAKPGSLHIWQVIEDIMEEIEAAIVRNNLTSASELRMDMDVGSVVEFTGPIRFSRGVIKSVQRQINAKIDGPSIKNLLVPKMVGDVLIFPGSVFSPTVNTYPEDVRHLLPPAVVKHHYHGAWKNPTGADDGKVSGAS